MRPRPMKCIRRNADGETRARNVEQSFRFGQILYLFKEECPVLITLHNNTGMAFEVSVIDLKVPFLMVLDGLRRYVIRLDLGARICEQGIPADSCPSTTQPTIRS